jgi:hypothetical protein
LAMLWVTTGAVPLVATPVSWCPQLTLDGWLALPTQDSCRLSFTPPDPPPR